MKKIVLTFLFISTTAAFQANSYSKSFFRNCHIVHNVIDGQGNLIGTYVYDIEIPDSKTCKEQSEALKPFSNWLANGMPGF